ncbi:hypothetical protein C8J38_107129 [Rhizobium sp. PP-WC-2G-219]|nr:hypothetical protein C8J38_107129 [Rhizobium sp. PP-WC-2G-219]
MQAFTGNGTHRRGGDQDLPYQCSRCNADMEEGFLLEKGDGLLSSETWISGKPVKSYLSGLNLKGKDVYDVVTFRCSACGYLDSYALSKQSR